MTWLSAVFAPVFNCIQLHPILASVCVVIVIYHVHAWLYPDPLMKLPCPPGGRLFGGHVYNIINSGHSPILHEKYARELGRNVRLRGVHPWETRLLPLDPVTVAHVVKNPTIYEKPAPSRRLIEGLIGCGMLAAEGPVHRRQRRVATPAFSIQNLRALVPLVFNKGEELKDRWMGLIQEQAVNSSEKPKGIRLDVCHWVSRATFDVIGIAGFDYNFNAIQNEENELFSAYKNMFETAVSQSQNFRQVLTFYVPIYERLFSDEVTLAVRQGRETISRVAKQLIQEKKQKIQEEEGSGKTHSGRDLLSLLLISNAATDLPPEQRISDDDILHNINTFMFAGSDTTSLALTWTLLLLAKHRPIQDQLRAELCNMPRPDNLGDEAVLAHYQELAALPLLEKVCRESLRIVPPVHSSIRVATQDDALPVSKGGGDAIHVRKGTLVHIPVEAMNLDREIWGADAWEFVPDRWDNLPEAVASLPGLYANMMTFSAGPRSCIGQRFSLIEMKTFLYILITNFVFSETDEKVVKANVVLTRPYLSRKFKEGSQCPMIVTPYVPDETM
ncbi:cytochrome-450 hydroxylase [Lactarius indigo]|nr:cytochrome-450 hydroxylase [Lactarius indigo]